MTLKHLRDGIYADTEGANGGNHGAIILDNEILMIDSGMIHTKSQMAKNYLESETGLPIKKLVFTHSHSDHVFGAQAFEPVLLISSELTYHRCKKNLEMEWEHDVLIERYAPSKDDRPDLWDALQTLKIRLPDMVFDDSVTVGDEKRVTLKLMGGHTSGSSIVIDHDTNTVFVGDLIFSKQFPYGGDPTCDPDRWVLSLEEIYASKYDTIIPGHGPICSQDELGEYIEAFSELRQNVKDAVKSGTSTESFVKRGMVPLALKQGYERFGDITLKYWFEFYS